MLLLDSTILGDAPPADLLGGAWGWASQCGDAGGCDGPQRRSSAGLQIVAVDEDDDDELPEVDAGELAPTLDPADDFDEDDFDDDFDDDFEESFEDDLEESFGDVDSPDSGGDDFREADFDDN